MIHGALVLWCIGHKKTVIGIVLLVVALGLVFRFSWGRSAEKLGALIEGVIRLRQQKREKGKDVAEGRAHVDGIARPRA